jgi:hypothetical protein
MNIQQPIDVSVNEQKLVKPMATMLMCGVTMTMNGNK